MAGTLALDIETVSPDREPTEQAQFRDSSYFELLAVGLGYRSAPGEPVETTVLFRDDDSPESELALVDAVCEWCADRPADTLVTYNGDGFDLIHLPGRADRAGDAVGDDGPRRRVDDLLALDHVDLMDDVQATWGSRRSLEWVCDELGVEVEKTAWADYRHSLYPDDWRSYSDRGSAEVLSADVPRFGERYLALASVDARDTLTFRELERLLYDYTVCDIRPLFEIADLRPLDPR
ncbi:hypothetical protein SAMN04487948_104159 [Halogranum amylolyticum]|uniref:Uncharacterized protein n=1 Tax=Halogranum amylolyticum TaxID=660520 RepID=A0A1H8RQ65_9EURY|nr:ribonuclease H-like domain-containing protein [Halogranum amylolyticum]SEO68318.1 hypothetical protein SAMN04487948_104159 [Halogranum amylolyticum]